MENKTITIEVGPKTGKVMGELLLCALMGPIIAFVGVFTITMVDIHILQPAAETEQVRY